MSKTVLGLLKEKLNPNVYEVSNYRLEDLNEPVQDGNVTTDNLHRGKSGENSNLGADAIKNVCDDTIAFSRQTSPFCYFLDGCRRAYYLCDAATSSGRMLPILAGQISAAVLSRDKETGRVACHRYHRRGILLLPEGGNGFPKDDLDTFAEIFEKNFQKDSIEVVRVKDNDPSKDDPKDKSLAKLNAEMQKQEVAYLEQMTTSGELDQEHMIIVDGALQFQTIPKSSQHFLRYAIGLSKNFNLHLEGVHARNKEIGTLLINLNKVGDRTRGFRLRLSTGVEYSFWYLRIRPREFLNFPFAGIVKVEKVLCSQQEQEDGLPGDTIDTLSRCLLLETSVAPYGQDFRWASHIYPIYMTEQLQKRKYDPDYFYETLLKRKVEI